MALSNLFGWNKKAETSAPAAACFNFFNIFMTKKYFFSDFCGRL